MEISYRDLRDHKVIMLQGDIDYFNLSKIKNEILKYISDHPESIIIDLKDVDFLDSAGIGLLVSAYKESVNCNGKIALVNVPSEVLNLLKLTTVDAIIQIYNNEDEIK